MLCIRLLNWMGSFKTRDIFHMFVSLTWLSGLLYYMLGQLIGSHTSSPSIRNIDSGIPETDKSLTEIRVLLLELGFTVKPKLYPQDYPRESNVPVFILMVERHEVDNLYGFLASFKSYYQGRKLIIYNLGLPEEDRKVIKSTFQCQIREVDWRKYPSHVYNKRHFRAYRPLLIQESLREFGLVFLCDVTMRFVSSNLESYTAAARRDGLVTWWHQQYPTSALTHYNMFRYFNTNHSNFYFQRVAQPNMALLVNSEDVHRDLMLPWIQCCLDVDCIAPRGSQPGGCNFMHKPKYIYAGCHHYDTSAYNILLGQMFNMDTPYLGSDKLFFTVYS